MAKIFPHTVLDRLLYHDKLTTSIQCDKTIHYGAMISLMNEYTDMEGKYNEKRF